MQALTQRDSGRRWLPVIALLLFCAGVLGNPPWKGYSPAEHVRLEGESLQVAVSLWHSGRFADAFGTMPTGPTSHVAPVYPFLQSLMLRWFGEGPGGWVALRTLATVSLSLEFALLPYLARLFGYSPWTGVLASLLGLWTKPLREESWEAHFAGLVAMLLTAAACRWMLRGRTPASAAITGLAAGFTFLLQPVMALVYFAWVLYEGRSAGFFTKNVLPLWIAPMLMCAPWAIRNKVLLGTFDLRDNLGTELYVSYNGCAPSGFRDSLNSGCFGTYHPNVNPQETLALRALGEYRYNQDRLQKALAWISQNRRRAAELLAARFRLFWFPPDQNVRRRFPAQPVRTLAFYAMTLTTFAGLYLSWKQRLAGASFLTLWIALFPLIYYVVQFDPRYRYPIFWITWLEAAYVAVRVGGRFVRTR